ncbi:MAG: DUF445 family protein [Ruminococcus sp.]
MLFRPHKEVRVWGWKLPFTPGVIPKGQGRLARAVGRAVEEQLLTREVLEEELLSEDKIQKIKEMVSEWVEKQKASEKTVKEAAGELISEEAVEDFIDSTGRKVNLPALFVLSRFMASLALESLSQTIFCMAPPSAVSIARL